MIILYCALKTAFDAVKYSMQVQLGRKFVGSRVSEEFCGKQKYRRGWDSEMNWMPRKQVTTVLLYILLQVFWGQEQTKRKTQRAVKEGAEKVIRLKPWKALKLLLYSVFFPAVVKCDPHH